MAGNRVECRHPSCKRSFESQDSMNQHFLARHSAAEMRKERYACEQCNRSFRKQEGLQDHMRSLHLAPPRDAQVPSIITPPCNDRSKANLKGADALHQHWRASANRTLVSKSPNRNHGTRAHARSRCNMKLPAAEDLEQQQPISKVLKSSAECTRQHVENYFRPAWIKPTRMLYKVRRIFKVYNPRWRQNDVEQYHKKIKAEMSYPNLLMEDKLELHNKVLDVSNELLRCHGTSVRKCTLGRPLKPKHNNTKALSSCINKDCRIFCILQNGVKKIKGRVKRFQRFCSDVSSKASTYVNCSKSACKASTFNWFSGCFGNTKYTNGTWNYKVMMVCRMPPSFDREFGEFKTPSVTFSFGVKWSEQEAPTHLHIIHMRYNTSSASNAQNNTSTYHAY